MHVCEDSTLPATMPPASGPTRSSSQFLSLCIIPLHHHHPLLLGHWEKHGKWLGVRPCSPEPWNRCYIPHPSTYTHHRHSRNPHWQILRAKEPPSHLSKPCSPPLRCSTPADVFPSTEGIPLLQGLQFLWW